MKGKNQSLKHRTGSPIKSGMGGLTRPQGSVSMSRKATKAKKKFRNA